MLTTYVGVWWLVKYERDEDDLINSPLEDERVSRGLEVDVASKPPDKSSS